MGIVFVNALILGLGSSLHCLGMCGPLVAAIPMKGKGKYSRTFGLIQYHLGKTFTYSFLGLIIGLIGWSIQTFRWMQILSILSGIIIIAFAWFKYTRFTFGKKIQQNVVSLMGKYMNKLFRSEMPIKSFLFGVLNGFLPCGLVYVALINSLLAGSAASSALAMAFFGLGTVPVLTFAKIISHRFHRKTNRWMPFFITLVGCLVILRGLNLGIPYISPKMEINSSHSAPKENPNPIECH